MKELAKQELPIIYLVDEELKTHFTDVRDVNILYYSRAQIPNNILLKLLEENFSDFEQNFFQLIRSVEHTSQKNF